MRTTKLTERLIVFTVGFTLGVGLALAPAWNAKMRYEDKLDVLRSLEGMMDRHNRGK